MSKLLVTRWNGRILTARILDGRVAELNLEASEESVYLGNIYIGKVKNIAKNINAAFIDLGEGRMGYYSLSDNHTHLFADGTKNRAVHEGDELIVQVSRDAVKTKAPVLSSSLNFSGRYSVLTLGNTSIGISAKIQDAEQRKTLKQTAEQLTDGSFGIIIRTNAAEVSSEELTEEIKSLRLRMEEVLKLGTMRTCYSCLYHAPAASISSIRDSHVGNLEAVMTDDREIFEELKEYLEEFQPQDLPKLTFYEDPLLPLHKLYRLESAVSQALGKRVWLKSGGYLVIEPTEALVVIDVNSGKYSGRKQPDDTILKINLEAADEIGWQLRLRNLSGIIIADFIDMERAGDKEILMNRLYQIASLDPVKTTVVEMTKLNLVEITRKKVRRPFYEQMNEIKGESET